MILTCDECQTRYLVPGHAIGPEGRHVRCMNCNHEWFQEPEETHTPVEEGSEEEEDDIEPIPESVKPLPEDSEVPAIPGDLSPERVIDKGRIMGYAAAAGLFVLVLGILMVLHGPMTKLWPASMALYDLAGIETHIDGEDLIFEKLQAVAQDDENGIKTLMVDANILNLTRENSPVPLIQTSLVAEGGEVIDSWLTEPSKHILGAEGEMEFKTIYPEVPREVKEVNVRFVPGSEISQMKKEKSDDKKSAEDVEGHDDPHDEHHDNEDH